MTGLKKILIGISDLKSLFQSINNIYSIDFSNYALSSFKCRIEEFMLNYHITSVDDLIHKIESDSSFFQILLKNILVDTTEMFRDPEFWDFLRIHILNKNFSQNEFKIWIPDCNSGEELYTLLILINQLGINPRTKVCLTTLSSFNIERMMKANIEAKKMEINFANYGRYDLNGKLEDFFINKSNSFKFKPELMENVEFLQHNLISEKIPGIFDLIIFRNKMLFYNPTLKIDALKVLNSSLKPGGFLAVGIKETIDFPGWEQDFLVISESERIFKKILR